MTHGKKNPAKAGKEIWQPCCRVIKVDHLPFEGGRPLILLLHKTYYPRLIISTDTTDIIGTCCYVAYIHINAVISGN